MQEFFIKIDDLAGLRSITMMLVQEGIGFECSPNEMNGKYWHIILNGSY